MGPSVTSDSQSSPFNGDSLNSINNADSVTSKKTLIQPYRPPVKFEPSVRDKSDFRVATLASGRVSLSNKKNPLKLENTASPI